MALEGSLDTFGLTDVLSLLAMTSKSGELRLRRSDSVTGHVRLRDGVVVAASSDDARQDLARQLIVSGLIPSEAFASAVSSGGLLAAALASAAGLEEAVVAPLARGQVQNAVFELLRWPDGDFTFDVTSLEPTVVDSSITVAEVIAEAQNRLAEWPALTARIPAGIAVLAFCLAVSSDSVLTPAEWGVLGLFDGHRTIAEAVTLSTSGKWETLSLLAGLIERGLLVPADSASSAAHRAELLGRIGLYAAAPVAAVTIAADVVPPPVVPAQAAAPDAEPLPAQLPEVDGFESLASLAQAAEALEARATEPEQPTEAPGDGIDQELLHRLMSGVRGL